MTQKKQNKLQQFIDILETTSSINSCKDSDIEERLTDIYVEQTSCSIEDARKNISEISGAIDIVSQNYSDLQESKQNGQSREEWLRKKLDSSLATQDTDEASNIVNGIDQSLSAPDENNPQAASSFKSSHYSGLNKNAIAKRFHDEIQNSMNTDLLIMDREQVIDTKREIEAFKEYFKTPLDSPNDSKFVKTVATATVIARDKGLLPKNLSNTPVADIALMVDQGASEAKVAYKLGNGDISNHEALDYIMDKKVAIFGAVIERECAKAGKGVGALAGSAIGSVFGPIGTEVGAVVGGIVGEVAGREVGKILGKGVKSAVKAVRAVRDYCVEKLSAVAAFFGI